MAAERRQRAAGTVRPYEPRDRAAVRDICCRTAFRNMGSDALFEDREIHADYWTLYNTDHRPDLTTVIEQDGEVVGYFFAQPDHKEFVRIMGRRIVPSCILRALWRWALGRYKKPETKRYIRHTLFHAWKEAPQVDYDKYPATYHCNMLRQAYGRGYYTQLLLDYLDQLEAQGIHGIHGHVTEAPGKGIWKRFEETSGFLSDEQSEVPATMFAYVTGDDRPMANKAIGAPVERFRKWVLWLREEKRL